MAAINYEQDYSDPQQKQQDLYAGLQSAAQKYFGRQLNQDELQFHASRNPGNYEDVFRDSTEGRNYANRQQQPPQPANSYDRNALSQAFQAKQFSNDYNINLNDFLGGLGGIAQGVTAVGPDKIRLPDGEIVDVVQSVNNGTGRAWWGSERDWAADEAAGKHAPVPGAGGGGSSSVAASSLSATSGQDQALRQQLVDQLTKRANQTLAVDRNDPTIRAQVDPYSAQVEREKRNYLADIAEKKGPLGNTLAEERLASERAGQSTGLFESQLLGREIDARRAEIQDALTQMRGMLSTEQTLALQQELAHLDDATKRLGLEYGNQQAQGQLALGYESLDNQLMRQLLSGLGS